MIVTNKIRICYFGIYNPEYSRNRILIGGLKENGVKVIECRTELKGVWKYFNLIKKHWQIRKNYDCMVIGFPGWQCAILARIICRKKIVFDAFFSQYDALVCDRQTIRPGSMIARYYWWLDLLSVRLSDIALLDTEAQIKYFTSEFRVPRKKFARLFIGASTDIYKPAKRIKPNKIFTLVYFGSFIPGHGAQYVVEAAKLLEKENLLIKFIGSGAGRDALIIKSKELNLKNVEFLGYLPWDNFFANVSQADVCLGAFGDIDRAKRVIHNKVYECAAMAKPVITAKVPAILEFFQPGDLCLVNSADPKDIAGAIIKIKDNPALRDQMARNCYNTLIKKGSPRVLGSELKKLCFL